MPLSAAALAIGFAPHRFTLHREAGIQRITLPGAPR